MSHLPCNCNPPSVMSNISGERCHVTDARGVWCAIVNKEGVYYQTLIVLSPEEAAKEQEHQARIQAEQAAEIAREARKQELKTKLDSGIELSLQEITELLKLTL